MAYFDDLRNELYLTRDEEAEMLQAELEKRFPDYDYDEDYNGDDADNPSD